MAVITLTLDTAHLNELCAVASDAAAHVRPNRVRLGLALQGAITAALAPGAPVAPSGGRGAAYQPIGAPGGWMIAQPVAPGGVVSWRFVRVRYPNGRLGPDIYGDRVACERDCARLNRPVCVAEDQI